jgi:hypothetical protein
MVKNFKAAAQGMIARAGAALWQSIFSHIRGEIFSLVMSIRMRSEFHEKFVGDNFLN